MIRHSKMYMLEKVSNYVEQGETERKACTMAVKHFLTEMGIEVDKKKEKEFINELMNEWRKINEIYTKR